MRIDGTYVRKPGSDVGCFYTEADYSQTEELTMNDKKESREEIRERMRKKLREPVRPPSWVSEVKTVLIYRNRRNRDPFCIDGANIQCRYLRDMAISYGWDPYVYIDTESKCDVYSQVLSLCALFRADLVITLSTRDYSHDFAEAVSVADRLVDMEVDTWFWPGVCTLDSFEWEKFKEESLAETL